MDKYTGTVIIGIVCAMIALISATRKKSEVIINFIMRAVLGTIAIYFINQFLAKYNTAVMVGINPVTVIGSGFLGLPGLLLFYGMDMYKRFF